MDDRDFLVLPSYKIVLHSEIYIIIHCNRYKVVVCEYLSRVVYLLFRFFFFFLYKRYRLTAKPLTHKKEWSVL